MTEDDIRSNTFAMPFQHPVFPPSPYRLTDRENLIVRYRRTLTRAGSHLRCPLFSRSYPTLW